MDNIYNVIGMMSGSSLDGVDIAYCRFSENDKRWSFSILYGETIAYSEEWRITLSSLHLASAAKFWQAHVHYGHYLGIIVKDFIARNKIKPLFVASHGHTIFHNPSDSFTCQIGDGAAIAAVSGIPAICDFRSVDLALGGQGAPLVPIGDKLLFGDNSSCLNIGGFANISMEIDNQRIAFDICPANFVLNRAVAPLKMEFDEDGKIAASGRADSLICQKLDSLEFYNQQPPKSLGREWLESNFFPITDSIQNNPADHAATLCDHISTQISKVFNKYSISDCIVTGGGAYNSHLLNCLRKKHSTVLTLPGEEIIDYKEALLFGLLGVLRWTNRTNCLSSVTGASRNNCGGSIYWGNSQDSPSV